MGEFIFDVAPSLVHALRVNCVQNEEWEDEFNGMALSPLSVLLASQNVKQAYIYFMVSISNFLGQTYTMGT